MVFVQRSTVNERSVLRSGRRMQLLVLPVQGPMEDELGYCINVKGFTESMGCDCYATEEWRLF